MSSLICKASSHFRTVDEVHWLSLSLESQYLLKDSWNSRTSEVNFHFRADARQMLQIRDYPGSFGTVGTYATTISLYSLLREACYVKQNTFGF